jgi:hypothetical protein
MRHTKKTSAGIGILTLLCGLTMRAQAPAENPFIGFWKLNLERSRLPTPPPANYVRLRRYEDQGGGWMFHTIIDSIGKAADFTFAAARYDEKEYPVYTSGTLGTFLSTGTMPARTVAFRRTDLYTLEYTDRQNGKISATGSSTVTKDGKTLTETNRTFDSQGKETSTSVVIYEKQVF